MARGSGMLKESSFSENILSAIGEFIGTTFFIFLALGGVDVALRFNDGVITPIGVLIIAFSFGFSLLALVWTVSRIADGIFNPAITLALLITFKITVFRAILYIIAQLGGAILGALFANLIFPNHSQYAGLNQVSNGMSEVQALFLEALLTTVLVLVVFMLTVEKGKATFMAPLAIGFTVFMLHLVGTPWTGTSINPARSFGPSVIAGRFPNHWIFWVGPFMGSIFGSLIYGLFKLLKYERIYPDQDISQAVSKSRNNAVDTDNQDSGSSV
ncbi:aquaporin-like protein [Paraphysoderma sedebokerense]|nr:aquaporin-like protein [Paraphysoderma sedebokerense]